MCRGSSVGLQSESASSPLVFTGFTFGGVLPLPDAPEEAAAAAFSSFSSEEGKIPFATDTSTKLVTVTNKSDPVTNAATCTSVRLRSDPSRNKAKIVAIYFAPRCSLDRKIDVHVLATSVE